MVLGLFEGELELLVGSTNFSAGQKITGSVRLKLPQPIQARALRIAFYGEIVKRHGKNSHVERIFETTIPIAGEKLYQGGESFPFELQLPQSLARPKIEGMFSVLNFLAPTPRGWFLHATLDLPNKLDINKRVKLNILSFGPPAAQNTPPTV